jgi:hypothetical protein
MRLHLSGVKLPKYRSLQDRVMRAHLTRESEKETKKTQLLALLVANSIDFENSQSASAWEGRIKSLWNRYLALEYGLEIAPEKEKELQMLEYYQGFVKNLRPTLNNKDGKYVVTGLDDLLKLNEYKNKQKG